MKRKVPIRLKKERVVLSEVLPFELPITFSNRHFYKFLVDNEINIIVDTLQWKFTKPEIETIIRLLFDLNEKSKTKYQFIFNSTIKLYNSIKQFAVSNIEESFKIQFADYKIFIEGQDNIEKNKNRTKLKAIFYKDDRTKNLRVTNSDEFQFEDNYAFYIFLNTHLRGYLKDVEVDFTKCSIESDSENHVNTLIKTHRPSSCTIQIDSNKGSLGNNGIKGGYRKQPFNFKITHKEKDFRELSIPHPFNQLMLVDFYNRYKEQILYYSKESKFSIRRPDQVAKTLFYNDKLHEILKGDDSESTEIQGSEYDNLKHFFTYKNYSNIHSFFEDYRYHRCEKKYKALFKFDIAKCFDSIYSHTIVWALHNKEFVKDNLVLSEKTFAGQFDKFMQNANYGETNGILIGPEFSRIFAELILQQIDKKVEKKLRDEGMYFKKDYELYRYVDDTFLFYNEDSLKDKIIELYKHELKEYKLSINDSKSISYSKPMITELSIAKLKVGDLFNKNFNYKIKEIETEEDDGQIIKSKNYSLYISSNKIITRFKSIIKESKIEYKDILNYSLATIDRKVEGLINQLNKIVKETEKLEVTESEKIEKLFKTESKFINGTLEILDFTFFIYSVTPRVNSTIKLVKILIKIINRLNQKPFKDKCLFSKKSIDLVFKKIQDDITLVLEQNVLKKYTQVETLYLLIILMEMGRDYYIKKYPLAGYLGLVENKQDRKLTIPENLTLNYFSISVLLFYIKDLKEFDEIKDELKKHILNRFKSVVPEKLTKNTEYVLLLFDLLNCPYIVDSGPHKNDFKMEILTLFGVRQDLQAPMLKFINGQKSWFTKWRHFDLEKEINSKISQEVYS